MKNALIPLLMVVGSLCISAAPTRAPYTYGGRSAQVYAPYSGASAQMTQVTMQSQIVYSSSSRYTPSVYSSFDTSAPSEYHPANSSSRPDKGGPKRDKIVGPDTNQSTESPIGEPWIMLIFAAIMGLWITIKNRVKNEKITRH